MPAGAGEIVSGDSIFPENPALVKRKVIAFGNGGALRPVVTAHPSPAGL